MFKVKSSKVTTRPPLVAASYSPAIVAGGHGPIAAIRGNPVVSLAKTPSAQREKALSWRALRLGESIGEGYGVPCTL
jgi:hypothetical protein